MTKLDGISDTVLLTEKSKRGENNSMDPKTFSLLRLCTINPRIAESDIKNTLDLIVRTGALLKFEQDAG